MRRAALPALLLLAGQGSAAAQAAARSYTLTAWDGVAVAAFAGAAFLPFALKLPDGSPSCAPCNPADLWGIDRQVLGAHSSGASTASDLLLYGVFAGAALAGLEGVPSQDRLAHVTVLAQAVTASYAMTGWLKVATERERPVMYGSGAGAAAGDPDSQRSFPSSHTAAAFAAATWYAVAADRFDLPHKSRNTILLFLGAATVGGLRLAAGEHFPTDVLAGAVLGAGVGWATAALHR